MPPTEGAVSQPPSSRLASNSAEEGRNQEVEAFKVGKNNQLIVKMAYQRGIVASQMRLNNKSPQAGPQFIDIVSSQTFLSSG
jgi:hypothetical protein